MNTYKCMSDGCDRRFTYNSNYGASSKYHGSFEFCPVCAPRPERPAYQRYAMASVWIALMAVYAVYAVGALTAVGLASLVQKSVWLVTGQWMSPDEPGPFDRAWWLATGEWMLVR